MTGKTLKQLRKRLNFSQAALARELRVEKDTVARWEQGRRAISPLVEVALEYVKLKAAADSTLKRLGKEAA